MKNVNTVIQVFIGLLVVLIASVSHSATTLYFVDSDHLGTPQALTDENQSVVWQVESQAPYGEVVLNEDVDGDGNVVTFNVRYLGQYFDEETNTNYNWHRTYDPSLGRYLQSDPLGLYDGPNTYAYVGGNPVSNADPTGLFLTTVDAYCSRNPRACMEIMGGAAIGAAAYAGSQIGGAAGSQNCPTDFSSPSSNPFIPSSSSASSNPFGPDTQWSNDGAPYSPYPRNDTATTPMGPGGDWDGDEDDDWGNYENPGHHDPSGAGPNPYISNRSVLPNNHQQLWNRSRLGRDGNRWAREGSGRNTVYHRFQNDGNGNWHWNGSTNGVTHSGVPRVIRINHVPKEIIRWR